MVWGEGDYSSNKFCQGGQAVAGLGISRDVKTDFEWQMPTAVGFHGEVDEAMDRSSSSRKCGLFIGHVT